MYFSKHFASQFRRKKCLNNFVKEFQKFKNFCVKIWNSVQCKLGQNSDFIAVITSPFQKRKDGRRSKKTSGLFSENFIFLHKLKLRSIIIDTSNLEKLRFQNMILNFFRDSYKIFFWNVMIVIRIISNN